MFCLDSWPIHTCIQNEGYGYMGISPKCGFTFNPTDPSLSPVISFRILQWNYIFSNGWCLLTISRSVEILILTRPSGPVAKTGPFQASAGWQTKSVCRGDLDCSQLATVCVVAAPAQRRTQRKLSSLRRSVFWFCSQFILLSGYTFLPATLSADKHQVLFCCWFPLTLDFWLYIMWQETLSVKMFWCHFTVSILLMSCEWIQSEILDPSNNSKSIESFLITRTMQASCQRAMTCHVGLSIREVKLERAGNFSNTELLMQGPVSMVILSTI